MELNITLEFPLHHNIHVNSGSHPASYPVTTEVLSLGIKWPGREPNYLSETSA
jgi:hypothetical protein